MWTRYYNTLNAITHTTIIILYFRIYGYILGEKRKKSFEIGQTKNNVHYARYARTYYRIGYGFILTTIN